MTQKKSLIIVDDHTVFREGVRAIIEKRPEFEVVGEAGNVRDGLKMAEKYKPDIFLVDISLPDKSGFQFVREICRLLPGSIVMMLSMHSKIDYISKAFHAGAKGYVVKESASERLLHGLETIAKGEYYLDSAILPTVIKMIVSHHGKKAGITDGAYANLTRREQEIMRLMAEGLSNKDIAEKFCLSPKTIENHRTSIMKKLNLHSAHELIRYATKIGLIDVDSWKN